MLTLSDSNDLSYVSNVNLKWSDCCLFLCFLVGGWQHAKLVAEIFAEIARTVESYLIGHFRDIELTLAQQLGGAFEAYEAYELDGSLARCGLEFFVEMHAAHAEMAAQLLDREFGPLHVGHNIFHRSEEHTSELQSQR